MAASGSTVDQNYRGLNPKHLENEFLFLYKNRYLTIQDLAETQIKGNNHRELLLDEAGIKVVGYCFLVRTLPDGNVAPYIRNADTPFYLPLPNAVVGLDLYLIIQNNYINLKFIGARLEFHNPETFVPIAGCAVTHLGKILELRSDGNALLLPYQNQYNPATGGWPTILLKRQSMSNLRL